MIGTIGSFFQVALQMGTPFLYATTGGILNEKVGHINLGVEGMMLLGASFGFFAAYHTASPWIAVLVSGLAGLIGALIYAVVTVTFGGNQTVTGLALSIFGAGVSNFLGQYLSGLALPENITRTFAATKIPILSDIPILGPMLFNQSPYVIMAPIAAITAYLYLNRTTLGLNARAVGENPSAADASGIPVSLYKYIHIAASGFLCGIGGAYLSLVFVPRWQDNITAGAGWIAVALVIFCTWNPLKAIFGAYFFGILKGIGFKLQGSSVPILGRVSTHILDMLPYVMTVVVLILISVRNKKENQPPKALSLSYFREER